MGALRGTLGRSVCSAMRCALALALAATLAAAHETFLEPQGRMLIFNGDAFVVARELKQAPTDALTFEAWVKTTDDCSDGTVLSYSVDPRRYPRDKAADNEFALFATRSLMVCRGFEWYRHPTNAACGDAYADQPESERNFADGAWHHLAAVWTAAGNGSAIIYKDGLLVSRVQTGKTDPLPPGGVWALGAEQDCFGGCFDPAQTFHGAMDDVRLWRVERTQAQILGAMFNSQYIRSGKDVHGLVGYWPFDENRGARMLLDAGMLGNNLQLIKAPTFTDLVAESSVHEDGLPVLSPAHNDSNAGAVHGSLAFDNTAAVLQSAVGMPAGDFTVELWARMPFVPLSADAFQPMFSLFSYGANQVGAGQTAFWDNAILLQVLNSGGYIDATQGYPAVRRLRGNLDVWVNGGTQGGRVPESPEGVALGRVVFDTPQLADGEWHHVAVSWRQEDGLVRALVDGQEAETVAHSKQSVSAGTERSSRGSLVLGQDQDSPGGGFSTSQALRGSLAEVRVWNEERSVEQVRDAARWPWTAQAAPGEADGALVARWTFDRDDRGPGCAAQQAADGGACVVRAAAPFAGKADLVVTSSAPTRTLSDAPHQPLSLSVPAFKRGDPAAGAFAAGHAVSFSQSQALVGADFRTFPASAATVEFWMRSTDKCRTGTPFSYATAGGYGVSDNSFTITNANNWAIAVNEDQGSRVLTDRQRVNDHAGVGSTSGEWTHVAVSWRSDTGDTRLYLDGALVWATRRAQGTSIKPGGTLVLGREQDCQGGCFRNGPASDVVAGQGAGAQDFRGALDELRIWAAVRTEEEIRSTMDVFSSPKLAKHKDLMAYYSFDEGEGHLAGDATGRGQDLVLTRVDPRAWVVSTVSEQADERAAKRSPPAPAQEASKKATSKKKKGHSHAGRAVLATFAVAALLGAGVAAWMNREGLAEACEPLGERLWRALAALRRMMTGRARGSGYAAVDDEFGAEDFAEAEAFTAYRPPT